jgi:transcriptional regulator of arginine metabolism
VIHADRTPALESRPPAADREPRRAQAAGHATGAARGLESAGCHVTQATVSRDIRELGLEKARDPLGRHRYILPGRERRSDPRDTLNSLLAQFGRGAVAAQNIVVIQSEIGTAPAIARALDRLGHPLVIGTLAGDDTCLVITADGERAQELVEELRGAIG